MGGLEISMEKYGCICHSIQLHIEQKKVPKIFLVDCNNKLIRELGQAEYKAWKELQNKRTKKKQLQQAAVKKQKLSQ